MSIQDNSFDRSIVALVGGIGNIFFVAFKTLINRSSP